MEVRLGGQVSAHLAFTVTSYEFQRPGPGDANWLNAELSAEAGPFRGRQRITIRREDLRLLRDELLRFTQDLSAHIEIEPLEPYWQLKGEGDGLGHLLLRCRANGEPLLIGPALEFEISIDQTDARRAIQELDGVLLAYPSREDVLGY